MRKELLWAGIIGITFGLVIGFGAWRIHSSILQKEPPSQETSTPPPDTGQFKIALNKPENYDVIISSPSEISGITKPLTWVVVSSEKGDFLSQSSEDGTFNVTVDLTPGINHIKASALNLQGSITSQKVLAVYSASFQTTDTSLESATNEADLEDVVAKKISQAERPPKSYIGTVTDLIDSTIQVKTMESQIEQIATNKENVAVVNIKGTNNKAVKLSDIAIGDFIIAMGYLDTNNVLNTQRILIADSTVDTNITASMFKVNKVTSKSLSLTPVNGGESITVTPDKNTSLKSYSNGKIKTIKLSSISESDIVIYVSDVTGSPAIPRTIFDIGNQ